MNLEQALTCAQLSRDIYLEIHEFHTKLQTQYPGCPIQVFQVGGCECACVAIPDKKVTLLIFRGTEFSTPNDFLANLDVFREKDPILGKVYIHSGFLQELKDVWKSVFTFVDTHARLNYHTLITTGHSLGGALALLCGSRLSQCFIAKVQCYSFGSPMIGGDTWSQFYNHTPNLDHYRFENQNDIVPKLNTLHILGYQHVGQRYYFNYLGEILTRPLTWKEEWKDWLMGQWQALKRMELFDSLKDHRIVQYVQILEQNLS